MPNLADFSRIVAAIYEAALAQDHWAAPLADIRTTVGAVASGLLVGDGTDRCIKSASLPAEARADYSAYYHAVDYVLAEVERGPVGLVRDGRELVGLHLRYDGLFVRLTDTATPTCLLVAAPRRSDPFATTERVEFVTALVPHWQLALRTRDRLSGLGRSGTDVTELIDAARHALIVLDRRRSVLHLNSAAVRILGREDGLRIRAGRIEAARPRADAELQRTIGHAIDAGPLGCRGGATMPCARSGGTWPYVIHVLPLGAPKSGGRALLAVVDPDDKPWPTMALMRRIFGMTHAEAEVAVRILDGDGLKPIAEELSLSVATVKTHLQHVFDKTGTHRQAELVRLLLAVIP